MPVEFFRAMGASTKRNSPRFPAMTDSAQLVERPGCRSTKGRPLPARARAPAWIGPHREPAPPPACPPSPAEPRRDREPGDALDGQAGQPRAAAPRLRRRRRAADRGRCARAPHRPVGPRGPAPARKPRAGPGKLERDGSIQPTPRARGTSSSTARASTPELTRSPDPKDPPREVVTRPAGFAL